jgi:hypothetical protein
VEKVNVARLLVHPNMLLAVVGVVAGIVGAVTAGRLVQARARAAESALNARYLPWRLWWLRDLPAGQQLDAGMLALRRMPRDYLPAGALTGNQAGSLIGGRLTVGLRRRPLQTCIVGGRGMQACPAWSAAGARLPSQWIHQFMAACWVRAILDLYYSRSQGDRRF